MIKNRKWIAFPLVGVALLLAGGWVVMLLWNYVMPEALGVKALRYPQALALLALSRLLFGSFGGGRGKGGGRMMHRRPPTLEERERLKEMWRERCRHKKGPDGQE